MFTQWAKTMPRAASLYRKCAAALTPQGAASLRLIGHRHYVGGHWFEMGRLQFNFLVDHGLRPRHYLLDIACGSLRAGIHLIPYLETGHYMGVDKEGELIQRGLQEELGATLQSVKEPHLLVSDSFEFEKLPHSPDIAIAQSLFSHLPAPVIEECFQKLRPVIRDDGCFYATFFETEKPAANPKKPHDHIMWFYTRQQMEVFGAAHGWQPEYIGGWNHPWGQVMMCYRPN